MKRKIDIDAILTPIPGDNPAGEDLRYTPTYDEIKEARRADDPLDRGEWEREIKTSDWDKVVTLAVEALSEKTKDLQIAVWLNEALTHTSGFEGFHTGLKILNGFLQDHWEHLYPELEEEDLDFRAAPIEFMNDKLWATIKQIPLTDSSVGPGYSWLRWQESRQVGYESDTHNQYGDVDDGKKNARDELIAEGKPTAEEFDSAVAFSSKAYYVSLAESLTRCLEEFEEFDKTVDERFGRDAPRLAELKTSLEDCEHVISRILKEKREKEPDALPEALEEAPETEPAEETSVTEAPRLQVETSVAEAQSTFSVGTYRVNRLLGSAGIEEAVWQDALAKLKSAGIKQALEQLLGASCSAQSIREKTNYRLLTAKLCLEAERPDLARPIAEELNTMIGELQLDRWESPIWIAEVLDTLYQCLTAEGAADEDLYQARDLLTKICTLDVTRAMEHNR